MTLNLYDILSISSTASFEDVKSAYRRAAMRWHPDRHVENVPEAEFRFKEISHAYEVLSNPVQRKIYDERLRETQENEQRQQKMNADAYVAFVNSMSNLAASMVRGGSNQAEILVTMLSKGCPEWVAAKISQESVAQFTRNSPSGEGHFNQLNHAHEVNYFSRIELIAAIIVILLMIFASLSGGKPIETITDGTISSTELIRDNNFATKTREGSALRPALQNQHESSEQACTDDDVNVYRKSSINERITNLDSFSRDKIR